MLVVPPLRTLKLPPKDTRLPKLKYWPLLEAVAGAEIVIWLPLMAVITVPLRMPGPEIAMPTVSPEVLARFTVLLPVVVELLAAPEISNRPL